jgi:hypothetical protein
MSSKSNNKQERQQTSSISQQLAQQIETTPECKLFCLKENIEMFRFSS